MKAKVLVDGNDGFRHVAADETYERDGSWIRRLLLVGLAEPLDDEALAAAGRTPVPDGAGEAEQQRIARRNARVRRRAEHDGLSGLAARVARRRERGERGRNRRGERG